MFSLEEDQGPEGLVPLPWGRILLAGWGRVCLSPHPHPPVGASCPAAALAHPFPADRSLSAAPLPAQLPLLQPSGCWSGLWAPRLVSLESWGRGQGEKPRHLKEDDNTANLPSFTLSARY